MKVGLFAEAGEERGVVWTRVIGGPLKLGTLLVVDRGKFGRMGVIEGPSEVEN